jgi:hypothetical protein
MSKMKRSLIGLSLFLLLMGLFFLTPWGRDAFLAGLLLQELATGREGFLTTWVGNPRRETVSLSREGRSFSADLYLPPRRGEGQGGLLLLHGLVPEGRSHPQLVHLASALTRTGTVVLVPDLVGLKGYRMRTQDTLDVMESFEYLARRPEVTPDAIGMVGISMGAGPALFAATHPTLRDRVKMVISFGGYADLESVITFVTTGHYRFREVRGYTPPREEVRSLFLRYNLDLLPQHDRERIVGLLGSWRLPRDVPEGLSREAETLYRLVINQDPEKVPTLIQGLPLPLRQEIEGLSPIRQVKDLRAELFLLHSLPDPLVPHTESLRLYEALQGRGRVHLALIRLFEHVDPAGPVSGIPVGEALKFYQFLFQVLRRLP